MKVILASGNKDKIKEIKDLLKDYLKVESVYDYGIEKFEVEEDGDTLEENSYKKAIALHKITKSPTLADDTGLFVNALAGRPGVRAHRYANENPSYLDNRKKLLEELVGKSDRSAYFATCICFIDQNGQKHFFEARIDGEITKEDLGDYEFGYDQIFKPEGSSLTFGQMSVEEKNKYSHRALAMKKFIEYLKQK